MTSANIYAKTSNQIIKAMEIGVKHFLMPLTGLKSLCHSP